jgi:hypothetical protein
LWSAGHASGAIVSTPGERIAAGDPYGEFAPAEERRLAPERLRKVIFHDVEEERVRQDAKFGDQTALPDGTSVEDFGDLRDFYTSECNRAARAGVTTWRHVVLEEVFEAMAESDTTKLRVELVQGAAVIVAWIEALDLRARMVPA